MANKTQEELRGDGAQRTCPHCDHVFSSTTIKGTVAYQGLPFDGMRVTLICPGCLNLVYIHVHTVVTYKIKKTIR